MTAHLVRNFDDRGAFARWFRSVPTWEWLACDIETTGLDPWNDEIKLVQFGTADEGWALRWPQEKDAVENVLKLERELVGWNGKFDDQFLSNADMEYEPNFTNDAKLMAHLLFSEQDIGLKAFADNHLGADSSSAQREMRRVFRETKTTFQTIPNDTYEYWFYGVQDTLLTARAAGYLYPMIVERGYEELYDLELEVVAMIRAAERRGMPVDLEYCQEQLEKLEADAKAIADRYDFNIGGKKALAERLEADGVKLFMGPPGPKTGRRQPILDDAAMREYGHPIADDVLEYRGLLKNAHTYFKAYIDHMIDEGGTHGPDWRVHTTMQTMRARTGRMSSSQPNLQNVPKREAGDYVRRAFKAPQGQTFVFADYHQIEYRIFASDCQEPAMIQAFLEGKDMHAVTAEMVLGHEPSKSERDMGKGANFTELFGGGVEKFAETAGISESAAASFKAAYHKQFPLVKKYMRAVQRHASRNLWSITTAFGRRIGVDADKPYAAVNYRIQGTAADVLKRAIVRVGATQWGQYLLLTVHDELIFLVPDHLVEQIVKELPDLMEDRETFAVPLTVEVSTGKRWGEQKEV